MKRALEFKAENRTSATAQHFASMFREIREEPGKTRELRGTSSITFPDDEFSGDASPLLDTGVQQFLNELFHGIPDLLYFLDDERQSASLLIVAAAFTPSALVAGEGDQVNLQLLPELFTALAQLLVNAAALAIQVGQDREVVLGHTRDLPDEVRSALRDVVVASVS